MKLIRKRRYAVLVDSLRRCVELLDQAGRPGAPDPLHSDYWREERDKAVRVGREVVRTADPKGKTDLFIDGEDE